MPPDASDLVVARGAIWRVLDVERGPTCRAVRLVRLHPPPAGVERTLLEPFDRLHGVARDPRPRVLPRRRAFRAALALLAGARHWSAPASAAGASIDLLPWQLEPAATLLTGHARRILLADAVGLGKTIEAGIAIAEVLARSPAARVLVLVPAGLRAQWRDELLQHFALQADVIDLSWLARCSTRLPPTVNPWTQTPLAIASQDFAKRGEVLPGPEGVSWSLVVVDEAHAAGAGTERGALVEAVCRNAGGVLLLSATPHNGDDARYAALRRLGEVPREPPLTVFRRERADVARQASTRHWCTLRVRLSPDERRLHALLDRYVACVARNASTALADGAQLAMHVLQKRAVSSAWALARTALRRQALLASRPTGVELRQQALWPLDPESSDEPPDEILGVPGLPNPRAEKAWLGAIAAAALCAARAESKPALLRRWLRRVPEPLLVFTEYRDSLVPLARALRDVRAFTLLHGGLSETERARAIAEFTTGSAGLLLATDAAAEGLNLHHRCRAVLMLDLPWTPTRLEQRIGRLDRMGQQRRVHAIAVVARDTFEDTLVTRLATRRDRAERALRGPAAAATSLVDAIAAELATSRRALRALNTLGSRGEERETDARQRRHLLESSLERRFPYVSVVPERRRRAAWSGAILIFDARLLLAGSADVDRVAVPVHVACAVPRLTTRAEIRAFVESFIRPVLPSATSAATRHVAPRWARARHDHGAYATVTMLARSSAASRVRRSPDLDQPLLFGRYDARSVHPLSGSAAQEPRTGDATADPAIDRFAPSIRLAVILLSAGPGVAPGWRGPDSQPQVVRAHVV